MTAPTANTTTVNGAEPQPSVDADSVGSQFAHEYYTFLNKEPSRLHLFYNKNSVLSHGYQGKDVDAIREKVVQLDFEDCKVLVQNIDSQTSLNGGIVIQVLGQMSNRGGIAQQFVQTFFLAEQPKGYYVLNDIFRFIKDDTVEDDEQEAAEENSTENSTEQPSAIVEIKAETTPVEAVSTPEPTIAQAPTKAAIQEEHRAPAPVAPAAVDEKKTADKKADKKGDKKSEAKETKKPEAKKEAEPVENVSEPIKAEVPAPVAVTAPVEDAPAPSVPAGPPKPKTWANLAAVNSNQWGAQASATKGASVPAPQPAAPKAQTKSHTAGQNQAQGQQVKTPGTRANGREEYHSIYIKNVTERMSLDMLRESFSKFGKVTHLEYTHKRNCAFLDFSTPDAMNAALKQNTVPVGNEIVLAEERRRGANNSFNNNNNANANGPQSGGRFHNNAPNSNSNGHGQQAQGGHRGARPNARGGSGGPSDRAKQPQHKQEKAAQPTIHRHREKERLRMSSEDLGRDMQTVGSNAAHDSCHKDSTPPEQEYDRYKDNPELLAEIMPKTSRLFSFDWANGFVSPFRPTPVDILGNLLQHVHFSCPGKDTLLDLGCGDGLVLLQALRTFPSSQLTRAIGVDLDRSLLETCRDGVLNMSRSSSSSSSSNNNKDSDNDNANGNGAHDQNDHHDHDVRSRLELYHGDLTAEDEPLTTVLYPPRPSQEDAPSKTMNRLLQESSHLFVYLLPEALAKLAPLLLKAVESDHKIVLSMRWEIEELDKYLVHGGLDQHFYIYSDSPL
ncbi:hypothetical protein EC968_002752 [Mortierella alpina]|nr:hypothetical protein EC968_002752 [Mortierella alpina]